MRLLLLALVPLFFIMTPQSAANALSFSIGEGGVYVDIDREQYRELRRHCRKYRNWDDYECRWFRKHRHQWRDWDDDYQPKKKKFYFNFDY